MKIHILSEGWRCITEVKKISAIDGDWHTFACLQIEHISLDTSGLSAFVQAEIDKASKSNAGAMP